MAARLSLILVLGALAGCLGDEAPSACDELIADICDKACTCASAGCLARADDALLSWPDEPTCGVWWRQRTCEFATTESLSACEAELPRSSCEDAALRLPGDCLSAATPP